MCSGRALWDVAPALGLAASGVAAFPSDCADAGCCAHSRAASMTATSTGASIAKPTLVQRFHRIGDSFLLTTERITCASSWLPGRFPRLVQIGHQGDGDPALLLLGDLGVFERTHADGLHTGQLHALVHQEAPDRLDAPLGQAV